jgi:hypothetical protein
VRFSVDPWDPAYGMANEMELLEPTSAEVVVDVERPPADWEPLAPEPRSAAGAVVFVDGVRRIEARVWLHDGDGTARPAICASYAGGAVHCEAAAARVVAVVVGRGLFTASGRAVAVDTAAGPFPVHLSGADTVEAQSLALQEQMGQAERAATEEAGAGLPADLIVVDGPLRGRPDLPGAVGYVKTHQVAYLPPELHPLVGRLEAGQRSPLFLLATSWRRLAWYFRLPGAADAPWAGVVRGECSPAVGVPGAAALADLATTTLQRFASQPHKEPRAPQNLYPIAGLERVLRRRLGDPDVLYRALRRAAALSSPR